jgi:hypothetical protein
MDLPGIICPNGDVHEIANPNGRPPTLADPHAWFHHLMLANADPTGAVGHSLYGLYQHPTEDAIGGRPCLAMLSMSAPEGMRIWDAQAAAALFSAVCTNKDIPN